jgi:O-antigen/teichoic acid export membrane protein
MRNRVVNLCWLMAEQGIKLLSGLFISVLVIKHLGAEGYGILSLSIAVLALLGTIVELGMKPILLKLFISDDKHVNELIETSCYLRLVVSIFLIIIFSILNLFFSDSIFSVLNILVLGFIFDSFLSFKEYFEARLINKYYTLSTFLSLILNFIACYMLIWLEQPVVFFAIPYVMAKFIQCVSLYYSYYQLNKRIIVPKINKVIAKRLIKMSYPMLLASSIGLIYSLQDLFFIKYYLGDVEVGIYSVGIKFITILMVLPMVISSVFYPSLVKKYSNDKSIYFAQLESIYLLFFILGISLYLVMYFSADLIIGFLFNDDFVESIQVMKIYSFLLLLSFFQSINNKILVLNNLQHHIFKRCILSLVINGILNVILIPKYGIIGAAYSTVISEIFVVLSYAFMAETRFIFINQVKAALLVNLFKSDLVKNLKS